MHMTSSTSREGTESVSRHRITRTQRDIAFTDLSDSDQSVAKGLLAKGYDRRELLSYFAGLGISSLAAVPLVATAGKAFAETPKAGGRLVVAHSAHGPSDTLDPIRNTSTIDYLRGRMLYGSLVRLNDELQPMPELATSFEANKGATEWTFQLRKDVEFHDGKPFTADDVIFSMNRHLGSETRSISKTLVDSIIEWKKVDQHTVKAILGSPNVDLPTILGTFHFKIVQDGETNFLSPNGTGPFKLSFFEPGVRSVVSAFDNYWGEGPYVEEIEYTAISDELQRITALTTGTVDIIGDLPTKSIRQVKAAAGLEVWSVESGSYYNIMARRDMAPGSNTDLVLAMKYLFDREKLPERILGGNGGPGNDQPIGPAYVDHCAEFPLRPFDPDQARFHLKRAGMAGVQIEIKAADVGPGIVDMCLLLQREASKIGLNVEVQKVGTEGYWSSVWLKAPICVAAWNMRPTANAMLSIAYHSQSEWNESRWKSKHFDQLLVSSRGETDQKSRWQMYCDMQEMVYSNAGTIIPVHRAFVGAHKSNVKGLTNSPLAPLGGCEWPEYVWIDS